MANNYNGYLLKFGGRVMPNGYITDYSSVPNRRSESNAETDLNGVLLRTTLPHTRTTITLTTHILHLDEKIAFQSIINGGIVNADQRKAYVEYWNDETNSYSTGYFYIPDIEFRTLDASANDITYAPITVELIEY